MYDDLDYDMHAILENYGWVLPQPRRGWVNVKCGEHDDSHASATLNADQCAVLCMACGFKGNAITIIMDKEKVNANDAHAIAARLSGTSDTDVPARSRTSSRLSRR